MKRRVLGLVSLFLTLALLAGTIILPAEVPAIPVGAAPEAYILVDNCDTLAPWSSSGYNIRLDSADKKEGSSSLQSTKAAAGGGASDTIPGFRRTAASYSYKIPLPENWQDWYLEFWFFVDDPANITGNTAETTANLIVKAGQTATGATPNEMTYLIPPSALKAGWNLIQLKLGDGTHGAANPGAFETLNFLQIYTPTTARIVLRLDDISLTQSLTAGDLTKLNEILTYAGSVNTAGKNQALVDAFNTAHQDAKDAKNLGRSQRQVDISAETLILTTQKLSLSGATEDLNGGYTYIDFNNQARTDRVGTTYCGFEGYAVSGGSSSSNGTFSIVAPQGAGNNSVTRRNAIRINNGNSIYFSVSRKMIPSDARDVRFSISYYNNSSFNSSSKLKVYYNTTSGIKSQEITMGSAAGPTNNWRPVIVTLEDACFDRSVNMNGLGFDIRVEVTGLTGSNNYVHFSKMHAVALPDHDPVPEFSPETAANTILGKTVTGFQVWFGTWHNWFNWRPDSLNMDVWPDTADYPETSLLPSNFGTLGSGEPARLFHSKDPDVLDVHFRWMEENNIDGAAVQRFYGYGNPNKMASSAYLEDLAGAAEAHGRSYYMMYDMSGQPANSDWKVNQVVEYTKLDFINNIEGRGFCSGPMYAHAGGKPVVCLWGLSSGDTNFTTYFIAYELTRWFTERGYYVIIGTPENDFRNVTDEWFEIYTMCGMISPWNVGRYGVNNAYSSMTDRCRRDLEWCSRYGIEYQPTMLVGSAWTNMKHHEWNGNYSYNDNPRNQGQFLWNQARAALEQGAKNLYIAMFDEYDESTAIMKAGSDYFDIPVGKQYFLTLSADGYWIEQDFYLRAVGDANRLLDMANKGLIARNNIPTTCTTVHAVGALKYRNSFEGIWVPANKIEHDGGRATRFEHVDPGTYARSGIQAWNGTTPGISFPTTAEAPLPLPPKEGEQPQLPVSASLGATQNPLAPAAKTGSWMAAYKGTITNAAKPDAPMVIAPAKLKIGEDWTVSYSIYAVNELGKNVFVDLALEDAAGNRSLLSDSFSGIGRAAATDGWQTVTYKLPESAVGKTITGIVLNYKTPGSGSVEAYIDDLIISSRQPDPPPPPVNLDALAAAVLAAKAKQNEDEYRNYCDLSKETLSLALAAGEAQISSPVSQPAADAAEAAITAALAPVTGMRLKGDLDGDDKVTISDARILLQNLVDKITIIHTDPLVGSAARLNPNSESVSITDARILLQYLVGKLPEWP
ncbi:MAG: hypothetical protein FWE80_05385 [Oscillospiraceae bacterium]|nr:hypothetical protein [Oscillospiraceae bacterium]